MRKSRGIFGSFGLKTEKEGTPEWLWKRSLDIVGDFEIPIMQ